MNGLTGLQPKGGEIRPLQAGDTIEWVPWFRGFEVRDEHNELLEITFMGMRTGGKVLMDVPTFNEFRSIVQIMAIMSGLNFEPMDDNGLTVRFTDKPSNDEEVEERLHKFIH